MVKRNTGLDILKVIAMIMIVFLHVMWKGKFIDGTYNQNFYKIVLLFETICIVAVNCFVLITGYFQVESKFKASKIIRIWIKVLFYSITIYIILLLFGNVNFNIKDAINSFFPILTCSYWFINCYLVLYILSPFINKLVIQLNKKEFKKMLIILLIIFGVFPSVSPSYFLDDTGGYGIIWFIILYLVGSYIRLYGDFNYNNRNNLIAFFLVICCSYLSMLVIQHVCNIIQIRDISGRLFSYNFVTVFIASVCLFLYFKNMKINNFRITNYISKIVPLLLAVYIIHEQVVLVRFLYIDLLKLNLFWNTPMQFLIIPTTAILIFLICILIEKITNITIQKWMYNIVIKFCSKFNKICKLRNV